MERKKIIGFKKDSLRSAPCSMRLVLRSPLSALFSLLFIFTLCSMLLAFFAVSVEAADKLVVTDGSTELFKVTDTGKVGIGTTNPLMKLHIIGGVAGANDPWVKVERVTAGYTGAMYYGIDTSGHPTLQIATPGREFRFHDSNGGIPIMTLTDSGNVLVNYGKVGIGTSSPDYLLHLSGGAYSDGTNWYTGCSREYKKNIRDLTTEDAMVAFNKLNPVTFNYKTNNEEKHVGFIAEDVPDLVASKDRKGLSSMDIVAVLTRVVQEQQQIISNLSEKVERLEQLLQ